MPSRISAHKTPRTTTPPRKASRRNVDPLVGLGLGPYSVERSPRRRLPGCAQPMNQLPHLGGMFDGVEHVVAPLRLTPAPHDESDRTGSKKAVQYPVPA